MREMRDYSTIGIHIPPSRTSQELRDATVRILTTLAAHGAWPGFIYRTGDSRQKALKAPISLTDPAAVENEVHRLVTKTEPPEYRTRGYWHPEVNQNDRHTMNFLSWSRNRHWPDEVFLEIPKTNLPAFESALLDLGGHMKLIAREVDELDGARDARATSGDGVWHTASESPEQVRRLIRTVFFDR